MAISSVLGSSALLPAGLGFRNVLINGGMDVWQRGTAVKFNQGQGAYGPDRWCGAHQFQNSRTQRVTVTPTSSDLWCPYACRVSNPSSAESAGGSRMRLEQKVESLNSYPLRGRLVTLSFWVRFSAANFTTTSGNYQDFAYQINAYTSTTDSATNTTAADVGTVGYITAGAFPTSWTKYTINYTLPSTTNNVEVIFGMIGLGIHTSSDVNWYEVTQVQLEANSQPTPFEQRHFGVELALCQRYFHILGSTDLHGSFYAGTASMLFTHLPVTMRAAPTASIPSGPYTNALLDYGIAFRTPSIVATQSATANNYAIIAYNGYSATYIPTTWYGASIPLSAEL